MTVNQSIWLMLDKIEGGLDLDEHAINRIQAALLGAIDREVAAREQQRKKARR